MIKTKGKVNRVIRGGSWYSSLWWFWGTHRRGNWPRVKNECLGFRLVRSV
jgi:formylglycine-generating enzyme required for sulfatase activity